MTQSFEERFDEKFFNKESSGFHTSIKEFIRQEKELSRKEERERIKNLLQGIIIDYPEYQFILKIVDPIITNTFNSRIQKINQEDK
jgi:hypothetical protein